RRRNGGDRAEDVAVLALAGAQHGAELRPRRAVVGRADDLAAAGVHHVRVARVEDDRREPAAVAGGQAHAARRVAAVGRARAGAVLRAAEDVVLVLRVDQRGEAVAAAVAVVVPAGVLSERRAAGARGVGDRGGRRGGAV